MPIRSENMASYPGGSTRSAEWQAIRAFMRARAGDRCEGCGVRHLAYGVRIDGAFDDLGMDREMAQVDYDFAVALAGFFEPVDMSLIPPLIRIVCTVAHLDGGLADHRTTNLRFWCQQCHNRHDAPARRRGVEERRRALLGGDLLAGA